MQSTKFRSLQTARSSVQSPIEIIFPLVAENAEIKTSESESLLESRESTDGKEEGSKESARDDRQVSITAIPENGEKPKLNILEVLKGMGHAFQLLMRQPNPVAQDARGDSRSDGPASSTTGQQYREQAEHLRSEINKRSGQLERVVAAAIEANQDKDLIVKRILQNLQARLGQAKQRADKILKEPESGELAVRTLNSINQGMGNLGSLVQHVLSRINISINFDLKEGAKGAHVAPAPDQSTETTAPPSPAE